MIDWLVPLAFAAFIIAGAPLRTALQLGFDEGYELMKAWLVSLGHPLYTEIWNDQPPVHTELLALLFRIFGASAYVGRLLTVAFATLLIRALYSIVRQTSGRVAGLISVVLLLSSSSFLQLSASAMLEIPAFSLALAFFVAWRESHAQSALWFPLSAPSEARFPFSFRGALLLISGAILGLAIQTKLTAALILPAFLTDLFLHRPQTARQIALSARTSGDRLLRGLAICRRLIPSDQLRALFIITVSAIATFTVVALAFYSRDTLITSLQSHFSKGTGSSTAAEAFRFRPALLLGDVALLGPAALGGAVAVIGCRRDLCAPLVFFLTTFLVHLVHRPYWDYYILHLTIPLAWLGAVGIAEGFIILWRQPWPKSSLAKLRLAALLLPWAVAVSTALAYLPEKLYAELSKSRLADPASENLTVAMLKKRGSTARWIFTDQRLAAFCAGLPIPPELAVIPSKRIWSGQISRITITNLLGRYRPELILLSPSFAQQLEISDYIAQFYEHDPTSGLNDLYVRKR